MQFEEKQMIQRRMLLRQAAALGALTALPPALHAQSGSTKVVKIVVPTAAGGSVDSAGRLLADALNRAQMERFIIENRAGAGGSIGIQSVVKSPADGQTLVLGIAATMSVQPAINPGLPYNPARDLAPIAMFAQGGLVVAVAATSRCRAIKDLVALAKEKKELTYGTGGQGTFGHLTGEIIKSDLGIEMRHIPYRGASPAVTDLIGGLSDLCVVDAFSVAPHVQSGKARILAIAGPNRHPTFPKVPTLTEAGIPFSRGTWVGLFAPAAIHPEIASSLSSKIEKLTATPDFRSHLQALGFVPTFLGSQATRDLVAAEIEEWKLAAQAANVRME